jgi:hypothetical protein
MWFKTIFFLVSLYPFAMHAQTADEVVEKYVDFVGGKKQWESIKTITTSGEYNYGGVEFPFSTYAKAPNLYKFVVTYNGKYYAQAFDGKTGWKIDAFKNETSPTLLTGKPALAMANEADVELEDALINYHDKGHQAILEGKDTVQGKQCFKVKFIRKNGEIETYYFEDKTFELVMKSAISKNAEMEGAMVNIFYSDYHNVDSIKIPFKAIIKSEEQIVLIITIRKAEIDVPIGDKEFQPYK